ncbi:MAG: hypothetical protein IPI38_17500 [Gemmatimonadetes bacterium]|nr:hypothetical protein [Gemmatimonadota bacterium]MBK6779770.1 hypothetical protein [Gemmatimonadota bacterium]MBK7350504.1 hypothetical protein [Gemmatimonadota bacterium]MBK7717174.1 hypothetical protein [Gemmatimonadota bacterium]MBK7785650.1 hypothetical protein [Gemmatimonadota bacterium]
MWATLVLPEDEGVGTDPESAGELTDAVEGGLGAAGLVAEDLDAGEGDRFGQGLLGEAAGLAESYIPLNPEAT